MASENKELSPKGPMNSVRSFLRGRSFPGTVKLSRRERGAPGKQQLAGSGNIASRPAEEHAADANFARDSIEGSKGSASSIATESQDASMQDAAARNRQAETSDAQSNGSATPSAKTSELRSMSDTRVKKFHKLLAEQVVDLEALRELAWSGIPPDLRPKCWQLLLGYLPPNHERREQILARKRKEYQDMVPEYYGVAAAQRTEEEETALRQVLVDVPRTAPGVAFFHQERLQKSLERILYIWGIRHPASGYVQGINDLVTPFLAVFLSEHFEGPMDEWCVDNLSEERMLEVEADSYWCLCKLLDGIQDHYTYAQPGIQRTVFHLKELVRRIDEPMAQHLEDEGLEFLQFAFRWVNCLLAREVPFAMAVRLWDTYLAEGARMKEFLMYVFAAFLLSWSPQLRSMEFQELILFLQKLPTRDWGEKEVEVMLSRAYMWRASFNDARSHLVDKTGS